MRGGRGEAGPARQRRRYCIVILNKANAAGIDNADSKWSREAQTEFVSRGLRQGGIINGSEKTSVAVVKRFFTYVQNDRSAKDIEDLKFEIEEEKQQLT